MSFFCEPIVEAQFEGNGRLEPLSIRLMLGIAIADGVPGFRVEFLFLLYRFAGPEHPHVGQDGVLEFMFQLVPLRCGVEHIR